MEQQIQDRQRRIRRYADVDGLVQLMFAALFLAYSLFIAVYQRDWLPAPALALLPLLAPLLTVAMLKLKEQITYRRTGYADLPQPPRFSRNLLLLGIGLVLLAALAALWFVLALVVPTGNSAALTGWLPLGLGMVAALVFAILGLAWQLRRFQLLAGVALGLGGLLSWQARGQPGIGTGMVDVFFALLGLILLLSGSWTLLRYLRRHPVLQEEG
jgi:hypothetical protein